MNDAVNEGGARAESRHFAQTETYLTADVPGTGGAIRRRPEDFIVDEIPLVPPSGLGEHFYLFVQKIGLTTDQVARMLAEHFGVRHNAVGFAGHKDRLAVTRQVFSVHVPGRAVEDFPMIEHERVAVLWADRHTDKLRRGELAGNRFAIRIRDADPTCAPRAARCLRELERVGVPNRVGVQRFGSRENNHLVGREIFRGRAREATNLLLGPSLAGDDPHAEVWSLYARGAYADACRALPGSFRVERAVLGALARGATPERALARVSPTDAGFYLSAFQSAVFNLVLERRMIDRALGSGVPGDLLAREDGSDRTLLHPAAPVDERTAARVARFEIGPTGPMWGVSMPRAAGAVDRAEIDALRAFGLGPDDLAPAGESGVPMSGGTRRPLRVRLGSPDVEGGLDEHGPYIRCTFDLPRGAFATEVLREVMKSPIEGETDD